MTALQEFARWKALKAAADAQWDVVEAVAITERGIAEGDTVKIGSRVGRVNCVNVTRGWRGALEVVVYARPFKKNGEPSLTGEFNDRWATEKAELVSKQGATPENKEAK